jgi:hypothetical protein
MKPLFRAHVLFTCSCQELTLSLAFSLFNKKASFHPPPRGGSQPRGASFFLILLISILYKILKWKNDFPRLVKV